jgi:hypothetical protein
MLIMLIVRGLLLTAEILLALPVLYLGTVAVAALIATRRRRKVLAAGPQAGAPQQPLQLTRFALLIPAHNEELVIGTLLESLQRLTYPADRYQVYVIADNCSDETALLARTSGFARVYERQDTLRRGKGYALNWMLSHLEAEGAEYDACVIVDADSVIQPDLLIQFDAALRQGLARGELLQALQASNSVLNISDSPGTALRWLALSLVNHVRPLGRNALGASATLTGNGMCLSRELLARYPWQAFSRGEDYQYYLTLVEQGIRVRYVPEALVRSQMPTTFAQMRSQDMRWEAVEPEQPARQVALRLLHQGLRYRDWVRLEAAAELLTPPLSVLAGGALLVMSASLLTGWLPTTVLGLLLAGGQLLYTGAPLVLLRPPDGLYKALLYVPGFVIWKLWVYLILRHRTKHDKEWIRTDRALSVK